jgi:hypothetical protein
MKDKIFSAKLISLSHIQINVFNPNTQKCYIGTITDCYRGNKKIECPKQNYQILVVFFHA